MIHLYSKENCPDCETAKFLLRTSDVPYKTLYLGHDYTKEQLLKLVPTARALPQVILDGIPIGGLDSLKKHIALIEEVV